MNEECICVCVCVCVGVRVGGQKSETMRGAEQVSICE